MDNVQKYLKEKYGEKKPIKRKTIKGSSIKIVDHDVSWEELVPNVDLDDEDAPTIVNFDEYNSNEITSQALKQVKWNTIGTIKSEVSSTIEDISPPRKRRHDSPEKDLSPPRKKRHDSPSKDISPPRRHRHESPPARKRPDPSVKQEPKDISLQKKRKDTPPRHNKHESKSSSSKQIETKSGICSAEDLKREYQQKLKEQKDKPIDDEMSGRNAKTIIRKKPGVSEPQKKEEEPKPKPKPTAEQLSWSSGIIQKKIQEAHDEEMLASLRESFARRPDDPEIDRRLREFQHWDDPIRNMESLRDRNDDEPEEYFEKKTKLSKQERKEKEKRMIEAEVLRRKKHQRSFQPNRFGIRPGRRWDGVDRSNGFEQKLILTKAKQQDNKKQKFEESISHY